MIIRSRSRTLGGIPLAAGLLGAILWTAGWRFSPADSNGVPLFVEVSARSGLDFVHSNGASGRKYIAETVGSGGGFLDFDNDGWLDVYLVNAGPTPGFAGSSRAPNRLYRNRGDATFEDVTLRAGVGGSGYGVGCAFADYDNDGFIDIYVTNLGPNLLYRNNGDGTFSDLTAKAGVGSPEWSTSAAFADYDRDGWVDLFVCNYLKFSFDRERSCFHQGVPVYCYPHSYEGAANILYRNRGDGTFEAAGRRAQLQEDPRYSKSLGAIWFDMDADADPDLFVANDTTANYLFENKGNGTFEDVSLISGTAFGGSGVPQACMGVDAADLLGDGLFSLFVTNFSLQHNALYINEGAGIFSDRILESGLGGPGFLPLGFGANFLDADNDGRLDLFVANGHVFDNAEVINPSLEYRQANQLFRHLGQAKFAEVSSQAGAYFAHKNVSRGSAAGDFNNDGRVDLLVTNINERADLLENRTETAHHWLSLRLQGTHCNRDAVGARVTLRAGDLRLTQEVRAGSSYLSQSDLRLHFGLGRQEAVDAVDIVWPCGKEQSGLPVAGLNRLIRIEEE